MAVEVEVGSGSGSGEERGDSDFTPVPSSGGRESGAGWWCKRAGGCEGAAVSGAIFRFFEAVMKLVNLPLEPYELHGQAGWRRRGGLWIARRIAAEQ